MRIGLIGGDNVHGWQLILADLALILFLVTLSTLAQTAERKKAEEAQASVNGTSQFAASQALFRPSADGPAMRDWLSDRPFDQRSTLTVYAQHSGADRDRMWEAAQALADQAAQSGYRVRTVITKGSTSDLYASLAYDAPAAR